MGALSNSLRVWIVNITNMPLEVRDIVSTHRHKLNDCSRLYYRSHPSSIVFRAKSFSRSLSPTH